MAYRSGTPSRSLVVRPDPIRRAISHFIFATFFLAFGVPTLFGKQVDVEHSARVVPIIFGTVFTAGATELVEVARFLSLPVRPR